MPLIAIADPQQSIPAECQQWLFIFLSIILICCLCLLATLLLQNKMNEQKRRRKEVHPAEKRSHEVLIEKSQINNPKLDEQTEKILKEIIQGIKKNPPAQPRRRYQKISDMEYRNRTSGLLKLPQDSSPPEVKTFVNQEKQPAVRQHSTEDKKKYISFDRKSLSFYTNEGAKATAATNNERKVEEKSFNASNTTHSKDDSLSGSQSSAKISKDSIMQKVESKLNKLTSTNLITTKNHQVINPPTSKRMLGEGLVSMKGNTCCIDLDSEQIIQVQTQPSKKKAQPSPSQ